LSLTGSNNAFDSLGSSTARYGCCDAGNYMSNPNQNPFVEGTSCSSCPAGQDGTTAAINDETSCCATVTSGSCTACSSFLACTAVTCDANKFDNNGNAADGCEADFAAAPAAAPAAVPNGNVRPFISRRSLVIVRCPNDCKCFSSQNCFHHHRVLLHAPAPPYYLTAPPPGPSK
jgi:hypothetical protein